MHKPAQTKRQIKAAKPTKSKKLVKLSSKSKHFSSHSSNIINTSPSTSFRATTPQLNSRRDKFAEAVLNIPKPKQPHWQTLSSKPVSVPGTKMPTGADLAPIRIRSNKDGYNMALVTNKIPIPQGLTKDQMKRRKIFLNTFPRQSASPAGPLLQTAYTNYSIYKSSINWADRLPGCDISISVKERADYTDHLDTRWYAEAMPRPRARVELSIHQFQFLTKLERDILGEVLGPRYNWQTGKIILSIGNLRHIHASINRCFQLVHEAMFRAIEIAPHVLEQNQADMKSFSAACSQIALKERVLNKALQPIPTRASMMQGKKQPLFYTSDYQHFVPVNDEFTLEQHLPYIPQVKADKFFVADTIPPGMSAPLQPIGENTLGLAPESPVVPGHAPYSYVDRSSYLAVAMPKTFPNKRYKKTIEGEFPHIPVYLRHSEHRDDATPAENASFIAHGVLSGHINPLDTLSELKDANFVQQPQPAYTLNKDGRKIFAQMVQKQNARALRGIPDVNPIHSEEAFSQEEEGSQQEHSQQHHQ